MAVDPGTASLLRWLRSVSVPTIALGATLALGGASVARAEPTEDPRGEQSNSASSSRNLSGDAEGAIEQGPIPRTAGERAQFDQALEQAVEGLTTLAPDVDGNSPLQELVVVQQLGDALRTRLDRWIERRMREHGESLWDARGELYARLESGRVGPDDDLAVQQTGVGFAELKVIHIDRPRPRGEPVLVKSLLARIVVEARGTAPGEPGVGNAYLIAEDEQVFNSTHFRQYYARQLIDANAATGRDVRAVLRRSDSIEVMLTQARTWREQGVRRWLNPEFRRAWVDATVVRPSRADVNLAVVGAAMVLLTTSLMQQFSAAVGHPIRSEVALAYLPFTVATALYRRTYQNIMYRSGKSGFYLKRLALSALQTAMAQGLTGHSFDPTWLDRLRGVVQSHLSVKANVEADQHIALRRDYRVNTGNVELLGGLFPINRAGLESQALYFALVYPMRLLANTGLQIHGVPLGEVLLAASLALLPYTVLAHGQRLERLRGGGESRTLSDARALLEQPWPARLEATFLPPRELIGRIRQTLSQILELGCGGVLRTLSGWGRAQRS